MPLDTYRLRKWFALAIAILMIVVAGFYARGFYARYKLAREIKTKAEKLGVDIQQSTDTFSLSKSEGGNTLFTIRASKAVQVKSGRAELHDVNIVVYGRESNRFDQIYGADFEYEPQTGEVTATGEVHIDLQGVAEGNERPDLAPPKELKNPIHLKTSGLVFNRNTGIARTDQKIEFRIPQATGSAVGATYNSKENRLTLHSDIIFENRGESGGKLTARSGVITKDPPRVEFNGAHLERPGSDITANSLSIYLRPDNTVERVSANGDVTAQTHGKSDTRAVAPRAEAILDANNRLRSAQLSGGVVIDSEGEQPMHGTAGRVLLDFGSDNRLDKVHALENVKLVQPPPRDKPKGQTIALTAPGVDFVVGPDGRRQAETKGASQITMTSGAPSSPSIGEGGYPANTVATADRFLASFNRKGRLTSLVGSPNAKVVSSTPGQPDKVTTSNVFTLTMNQDGGLSRITQEGNFRYVEASAKSDQPGTEASAGKAIYDPQSDMFTLTGDPRISDSGVTSTAERIRINRRNGEAIAEGAVKTTYSQIQEQPNGALLATTDPIHVTASSMIARRSTESARYTGGARLWQGPNIVEAPSIDFNRATRTVTAQGQPSKMVSTVFVEQSQNGKQTPVNVTGLRLTYVDGQRQARFEGKVVLRGAEGTMTADNITVYLQPRGPSASNVSSKGASQLEKVVADGHVVLQQDGRRGTGNRLTYLAKNSSFTLSGGSPSIFDAEHGQVTGDSLTFFSHDDRVLVEGGKTAQSVTKARVIK